VPHSSFSSASREAPHTTFPLPDRTSIIRLVGPLLTEQHDEWAAATVCYMNADSIAKADAPPADAPEE
jgi:hypothetical protein